MIAQTAPDGWPKRLRHNDYGSNSSQSPGLRSGVCRSPSGAPSRSRILYPGPQAAMRAVRGGRELWCTAGAPGFRASGGWRARSTGMMAGSGDHVAGGPARHVPVLARAAIEFLKPRDGGVYVDGTFGAGGYSRAILAAANTQVIGIDRDRDAIARGYGLVDEAGGRLTLAEARFSELEAVLHKFGHDAADGVVLDLGVSSMQLDEAERGFSFRLDGPLDMRMGGDGPSAGDVVAKASE